MWRIAGWLFLVGVAGGGGCVAAQSIDAATSGWYAPQQGALAPWQQPSGSVPTDQDFDPAFGTEGKALYFLNYPNAPLGQGLRVYPMDGGAGWYVLARHQRVDGNWDAAVIRVRPNGLQDKVFLVPTPLKYINDAAWDTATGKFYFAGAAHPPALPGQDDDFAVTCVDIDSTPDGAVCTGFANGGTAHVGFNLGGPNNDIATRVLVRPNIGLLLIGTVELSDHKIAVAAASLYRGSGAVFNGFGTNGRFYTSIITNPPLHTDVHVYDATLSNDPDLQTRLYISGDASQNDELSDYIGYVLAVKAMAGVIDTTFNPDSAGPWVLWRLGDCTMNCRDAVSAIKVLANGNLLVAGWSTDADSNRQLVLAKLKPDASFDTTFSQNGLYTPGPGSHVFLSGSDGFVVPKAIGERPDRRDLVLAMDVRASGAATEPTFQVLGQWSADAHAEIAGAGALFEAESGALAPLATGAGLLVDADSALLVGSRRWSAPDWDVTLIRTLVNDTIFADLFGGATSD